MRTIVHLDADAFFASVEQAADARLRGKPMAVGGESRGIIASASYEARKFGVYTPMPTARARKLCPKLIVLPGDYERYEQFSNWMFGYAYDFTPNVEQTSIDEGYFDITANHSRPPVDIAETISRAIRQSLKISVSEGIASNKLISQIASKLHKPAAFHAVPAGGEKLFLHPLPNKWLPGVGPKSALRLNAAGLAEIGQIAAVPLDLLELLVGNQAPVLRQFANGIDERPLIPAGEPQKTFSQQETFSEDVTDEEYVEAVLRRMADQLFAKVREENRSVRTLTVKVRYNDRDENQRAESLREPTDLEADVYGRLHGLLRAAWQRRVSLRMVSLKLSNVYDGVFRSELALDANEKNHAARERLAVVLDDLRRSKGWSVVLRGHDLRLREAPVSLTACPLTRPAATLSPVGGEGRVRGRSDGLRFVAAAHPQTKSYIPLRVRSHYTFLDSTLSPAAIVNLAKQHGMAAIALTDLGNLHGAVEFAEAAQQAGIKPIFGTELNVNGQPLLLYVESARGYSSLNRLLSLKAEGKTLNDETAVAAKQRAPVSLEFLERNAVLLEGLIAVSVDPQLAELFPDRFYQLATAKAGARNDRAVFHAPQFAGTPPHPALSPGGGEGESLAAASGSREAGMAESVQRTNGIRLLFPSPSGRGIKGEGERFEGALRAKLVACPPVHYALPADRMKYDIVQSIRTRTLLRQEHPEKNFGGRFHFRTPAEMATACKDHPEWLAHSREIAERCNFAMPFGKPQFPPFAPPDGSTPHEFLRQLVLDGARRRYGQSAIGSRQSQIEQELRIITAVGYEEYFLVVWSILQDCRAEGIEWITRGSAADSLVCYCLGISNVCPIRFRLYFRRFLNEERMALNKLPDIDIDFPHDRKDDVVNLIFARYGRGCCAVVGGFSTFQARSAFADVAKVLGVAEREVRKFTDHFPWSSGNWSISDQAPSSGTKLRAALVASPENRDLPVDEEPFKTALTMAEFLDGVPRNPKMHPCGVVLSRQPMHELTPTFIANKGYPTTHFDMDAVEAIGLVKVDVLAQAGLAAMRDVQASLAARGIEVDLETCTERKCVSRFESLNRSAPVPGRSNVMVARGVVQLGATGGADVAAPGDGRTPPAVRGEEALRRFELHEEGVQRFKVENTVPLSISNQLFDDMQVWDLISSGGGRAVHHIESPAMTGLCRQCNVRDIDTLIAIVSVIRPGAANEGKKLAFTRRYQGLEPVTYPHPSLAPVLSDTFGLVVYEEHILQICEAFAGLPPGRADVLRRALNKHKAAVIGEIQQEFFAAAKARGHDEAKIEEVWSLVAGFAGYAFCKAHSTAYGVEAYQSAWLKKNFPAEFMAAVLTNGKGFYDPLVYVLESHRLGVKFLPPTVNAPGPAFAVEDGGWKMEDGGLRCHEISSDATPAHCESARPLTPSLSPAGGEGGVPPGEGMGIRVPLTRAKGLTERTIERLLAERARGKFLSLADFHRRVLPAAEELETLIRAGGFDEFGASRTRQFWEAQRLTKCGVRSAECGVQNLEFDFDAGKNPVADFFTGHPALLREPTRLERLEAENELFGFAVSGHPLELFPDVAWDTYCPVSRLKEHVGQEIVTCGLVVEQRTHHQVTGEPMKFLTLADWTGMVETELFAQTYKSYGLATVRYPVLEVTATVEPFENGRGFSLRVLRAGPPRTTVKTKVAV